MQEIATQSATLLYFSPNEKKLLYVATQSAQLDENLIPPLPAINCQPQERTLHTGTVYLYDSEEDTNFAIARDMFDQTQLLQIVDQFMLPTVTDDEVANFPSTSPSPRIPTKKTVTTKQSPTSLQLLTNSHSHDSPVDSPLTYQWFPDSYHLILTGKDKVSLVEYDGSNETEVYGGMFLEGFSYPWPNGQKLVILTSLTTNPLTFANLYGLNLE